MALQSPVAELAPAALVAMQERLNQSRDGRLSANDLSQWALAQQSLLEALPSPFRAVLQDLLNRLEAAAMFSEESCSFSQKDLFESLQLWLDKAAERLSKPVPAA